MYSIVCLKEFAPYLENAGCKIEENSNGMLIETNEPQRCQSVVDKLCPGYKLLFGNSYKEIIKQGKYFTV
jgi:hypothetical protein